MKMKKNIVLASVVAVAVLSACRKEVSNITKPNSVAAKSNSSLLNNVTETASPSFTAVQSSVGNNIGAYYVGLPSLYDSTTKNYPLLVFLHGIGQLANESKNVSAVATVGVSRLLNQHSFPASFTVKGQAFSFIVVSPQFKEWPKTSDVNALVDFMAQKYRIDASRIYVVGESMGGGTTWDFAGDYSSRVAAIVPISGASFAADTRCANIANGHVAVWAFHNSGDKVVSSNISKQFVDKINADHADPAAKLTVFSNNEHDAWTKATDPSYKENGMNIYEWMLQYSKSAH
jgi:predicted peptidase